jgi:glycosyltransferase involved in cell wall biosynthesis
MAPKLLVPKVAETADRPADSLRRRGHGRIVFALALAVLWFKKDALVREAGGGRPGARAGEGAAALGVQGRVCSALFFFPRGGSAQVARALAGALPARGWRMTLATGSLGEAGDPTHAGSFYSGIEIAAVDYTPALRLADPLAAAVPFQPSYEDRAAGPDRVFAVVEDAAYERLVAAWAEALARAGAGQADLFHLHHLTPAHEAARRAFPALPIVGQLHGTELAFLRTLAAGPRSGWRHARVWEQRLRCWAGACARLIVPPGAEAEVAALLGLERSRLHGLASGVELERFRPQPRAGEARRAFWRRWLVEDAEGWDERGRPGSVSYREEELFAFASEPVFLYLGRFTAVKRLPLLIRAHARAQARLERPCPLVLVGGHPGEWEGEHPLETIRQIGARQVFLAGWRAHEQLPEALNAADLLVLPSVAEAFGLALVEAMACGLPVIACASHGPAEIVRNGESGWLVPPDDEQALEQAFIQAASQPDERRRRGQQAAAQAVQRYGWAAIATQVAGVYEKAVGQQSEETDAQTPRERARG